MFCPRCGETLERISNGVENCARCEGVWLAAATLSDAFGTPSWPSGRGAWWRRSLQCPACASEGAAQPLTALLVGQLIVDRCATHGLWLDHGELGRLLDAPPVVELEALYERLKPGGDLPPALVAQRKARQDELDRRQREIEEYRAKLAAEHTRIVAEREAAERARLEAEAAEERKRREQLKVAERARLEKLRAVIQSKASSHERTLVELRTRVRYAEGDLAASRARLQEVERQLEALDRELP